MWRLSLLFVRKHSTLSSKRAQQLSNEFSEAISNDKDFLYTFVSNLRKDQARNLTLALHRSQGLNADAAFRAADRDKDGILNKHEFRKWYENATSKPVVAESDSDNKNKSNDPPVPPTSKQLRDLAMMSAVPFVGFGFMDNFGMIVFGEYIDSTLGVVLGLSTMMAAGLGNAVADVVGIGFGQTIEALSGRLGLPDPNLTETQRRLKSSRYARTFGTCFGLFVGCMLGLVPLFFIEKFRESQKNSRLPSNENN